MVDALTIAPPEFNRQGFEDGEQVVAIALSVDMAIVIEPAIGIAQVECAGSDGFAFAFEFRERLDDDIQQLRAVGQAGEVVDTADVFPGLFAVFFAQARAQVLLDLFVVKTG